MTTTNCSYLHDGIPLWILAPPQYDAAVLLYHGLHSNKEAMEKEMWSLVEAGFMAVGVDAIGHGQRQAPREWNDPEVRFGTLRQTALEAAGLVSHLRHSYPQARKIGGLGVSLGGFTLFSALAEYPGLLDAACLLLGSPRWPDIEPASPLWQHSPHHWPDRYFPTALLVQTAGQDEYVRSADARDFCQVLSSHYSQAPERLSYREYPHSGHFMRGQDWDEAWLATLDWFARFLR